MADGSNHPETQLVRCVAETLAMRDPEKLEAFVIADQLALRAYQLAFPKEERYGLQSQIRRAAVSVPANLVEGCKRKSQAQYMHHISIALGSTAEVRYLIGLAGRLGFASGASALSAEYGRVEQMLQRLYNVLEAI